MVWCSFVASLPKWVGERLIWCGDREKCRRAIYVRAKEILGRVFCH
ncbi:MAG: hypothetical protein SWX82_07670 [Cyanobacteriota bacterium]|nr:hypothetical protein [Cyanobacteriota bacterium]